ncbi:MAG: apolipoprotein N-acyltransferase [Sulfurimonas sp.]|jgi:apolipoprotein N-acyltransferase
MIKNIYTYKEKKSLLFNIVSGILTATLFSAFIYLEDWGITIKLLNTIFGISSLALLLYIPKKAVLIAGFMIGLLWFYWIGYSFEYNGVGYLAPLVTLGFALIYTLFFGVLALTNKVYIRAILLFALSFFQPFDWNWLQIELVFVDSYIGVFKYQLVLVLVALSLPNYLKNKYKYATLLLLALAINFSPTVKKESPLKIKLVATEIPQDKKWQRETLKPTVLMIFQEIQEAKNKGYEIVVFPESVFPLYMNKNPQLINKLLLASKDITIIAGSLFKANGNNYNVTYIFQEGKYEIAKKLVLVPFGEYIPLPKFAQKIINDFFFDGQADFSTATKPTDFYIKGIKFRNAICYEATCAEIYEGDVDFVIATSNNAWFAPSIEPTIQKLLMRYYARKNDTTIYHSANYKGTGIIR